MDNLKNDIERVEKSVIKYIYLKYIQDLPLSEVLVESVNLDVKRTNKILNKDAYKNYSKNILTLKRKCNIIDQKELIREDMELMAISDKAYESNPREFKASNFDILPDILRCSFIRKHHHRFSRCRNRISNDDSDVCKKHEESENIYLDAYNELLEKLGY